MVARSALYSDAGRSSSVTWKLISFPSRSTVTLTVSPTTVWFSRYTVNSS